MSASLILLIALIKLLSPRRLFKHSEKLKKVKNSGTQASYVHFRLVHKPR